MCDTFGAPRRFPILAVIGDRCREKLGLIADTSISGDRVTRELDALVRLYGTSAPLQRVRPDVTAVYGEALPDRKTSAGKVATVSSRVAES